ncbi:MAG: terminase large subunit domain-containing protein [Armatimonadota bacterium]
MAAQTMELPVRRVWAPSDYLGKRTVQHPTRGETQFELYPYQRELLGSRAAQRIVVKARQVGISQAIAGEALCLALGFPGTAALFVSRNLAAAQHLQQMVYHLMRSDPELGKPNRRNDELLQLANGSSIRSLPATEDTGRTFSATAVYLDEFAYLPWAEEIYQAVAPCAALGGRITVISTPRGKANAFYRLWQESAAGKGLFERHRIHWSDCPEYNPEGWMVEDPEARRLIGERGAWYQAQRQRFTNEQWAQEYECDFIGSGSLVYREFDPGLHVGDFAYNPDWPTYVGQDFGYTNPSAALVIQVSPSEDVFVIEEHYHSQRSLSDLAQHVYRPVCDGYQVKAWHCDPAGAGEIAELQRAGIPATSRRSRVEDGIIAVRKLLRPPGGGRPRLHVDRRCEHLIAELTRYRYREGSDEVLKDQDDHGPDALRYFVMGHWAGAAEAEGVELR